MANKRKVGNLLALAVLSYLTQRPMHPYELSRTLRENGDARSIKFNHGSLYMVVGQLAMTGTLTVLYNLSILVAWVVGKKRKERADAEERALVESE